MTDESGFDPTELEEMSERLGDIIRGEGEGYEMIFYISHNDALELIDAWHASRMGEPMAMSRCWTEFNKIMQRLESAVEDDIID